MTAPELSVVLTTFLLIFPAELPDKTFVASLVLATRFPRLAVWTGVSAAFAVHAAIAVAAGGLLALLPGRVVAVAAGVLFAVGAVIMLRSGLAARGTTDDASDRSPAVEDAPPDHGFGRGFAAAFGLIFVAEWGDLSQLMTAGLAARTGDPVAVFLGSWAALSAVAGLAVLAGSWLTQHVPLARVRLVSAGVLAVLSALAFADAVRG